ncbi:hypothetical protein ACFQGT_00415 [Natrialbaceae archaeon GCM10025810]
MSEHELNLTVLDEDDEEVEDPTLLINGEEVSGGGGDSDESPLFDIDEDAGEATRKDGVDLFDMRGADIEDVGKFDFGVALSRLSDTSADDIESTETIDTTEKDTFTLEVDSDLEIELDAGDRDDVVYAASIRLDVSSDADITWPDSLSWPNSGDDEPTWTDGGVFWISVATADGGSNWEAFIGGENY